MDYRAELRQGLSSEKGEVGGGQVAEGVNESQFKTYSQVDSSQIYVWSPLMIAISTVFNALI